LRGALGMPWSTFVDSSGAEGRGLRVEG